MPSPHNVPAGREEGEESVNYIHGVPKNANSGNKMSEVGIANRRRHRGEQWRRVFFFFFVKTLSSMNVKGSGVVSPNDSDKSHLSRRSLDEI